MLYFSSEEGGPHQPDEQVDKRYKISPLVDHIRSAFKNNFSPFKNVCLDESLILFKGRLLWKQYIPKKRSRFGIKLLVICDVETDYVLDCIVYAGSGTEIIDDFDVIMSGSE